MCGWVRIFFSGLTFITVFTLSQFHANFLSNKVYPEENLDDLKALEQLRDALVSAEPIRPQLDRSMRVLLPAVAATHMELPSEFFNMTADELKKEMQNRQVVMKERAIHLFEIHLDLSYLN